MLVISEIFGKQSPLEEVEIGSILYQIYRDGMNKIASEIFAGLVLIGDTLRKQTHMGRREGEVGRKVRRGGKGGRGRGGVGGWSRRLGRGDGKVGGR